VCLKTIKVDDWEETSVVKVTGITLQIEINILKLDYPLMYTFLMDFDRKKNDLLHWQIGYRVHRVISYVIGKSVALKIYLFLHRMIARFAHELSGNIYGPEYHNKAFALSEKMLLSTIPFNSRVLDVGCGTGRFSFIASSKAREVVSIDHNSIHFNNPNFLSKNITTVQKNIDDDFFDLGKFDLALLIHILEHIDNPISLLEKLSGMTSQLIIEVPDVESDPLNWSRIQLEMNYSSDDDHVREYTFDQITDQLNQSGWKILDAQKRGGAILIRAARI